MQWVKLGEFIEQCDERNVANCDYPVIGINKDKLFMPTVANTDEIDLKKYKIIRHGQFIFSGMQTGRDVCIRIGLYDGEPALISPAYTTFVITKPDVLLPEFIFMYFKRTEMDRYGWFISDSSVRSNLDWPRFLDIEIPLPSIDEQKQVVAAWRGLKNLGEQNEQMAGPLMDLCQSYLQDLKHKYPLVEIGPYIHKGNKNTDNTIDNVLGMGQSGFIRPQKTPNESLKNYKIITYNDICYAPPLYNILSDALHLYKGKNPAVCSPIYEVFAVQEDIILPEYLLLWLKRPEFKRYAEFYSMGVRNTFDYSLMEQVKIPLPPIEIQRAIVEIYNCARTSKYISESAKKLNSDICPALMRQIIGDNQ
jgi:type I restriction enzyme S subunit